MNSKEMVVRGIILRVRFDGAGPNSGEVGISLNDDRSYWLWMNTPRDKYLQILDRSLVAMWDLKTVEIKYILAPNGDWGITSLEIVP
jgi:hypothetical protein